jgi:hypothetical protein
MSTEELGALLRFFKVLANESRLKILGLLATEERSVGELASILELKEPTISHHLALMKGLGLVSARAEGTSRFYRLETKSLEDLSKDVFSGEKLSHLVDEDADNAWENKVLRNFMDGDQITQIPAQQKKKLVILRWLVEQFQFDVSYAEKEVNEKIKRHHPDYAALRRYLVEHRLMQREKGVYRRV